MSRVIWPNRVCLLNPSEFMSLQKPQPPWQYEHGLTGLARETLINLAKPGGAHFRWSEPDLAELFSRAGVSLTSSTLRMGSGLIRYACGKKIVV